MSTRVGWRHISKLRNSFNLCVANHVYSIVISMGDKSMTDRQCLDRYFEEAINALEKNKVLYDFELRVKNIPVNISAEAVQTFRKEFILDLFSEGQLQADHDWKRHIYEKTKCVIWRESRFRK